MAEGGRENQENPFSFKQFVKKKAKTESESDSDDAEPKAHGVPDLSDLQLDANPVKSNNAGKSSSTQKDDDNPFSFKKFLKTGPTQPKSGLAAPDFASDLPDFVQDHFTTERETDRNNRDSIHSHTQRDLDLPDFALDSTFKNHVELPTPENDSDFHFASSSSQAASISNHSVSSRTMNDIRKVSLPDFLSDSAINTKHSDEEEENDFGALEPGLSGAVANGDIAYHVTHGNQELELMRLHQENKHLRQQLEEARAQAEKEARRVAKVMKEMEDRQKRESEETAALEQMVHKVEENLETTTKRAVKAENASTKLKQEVRALQSQITVLQAENTALKSGDQMSVRDKAKYLAGQIGTAANSAEQQLKQLLAGVDSLKTLSNMISHIDMVTEPANEGQGHQQGQGQQSGSS